MKQKPRRKPRATGPCRIHPDSVYFAGDLARLLGVGSDAIRQEIREGRLRVSVRAGRYFFLGAWLLEWIRSGERQRVESRDSPSHTNGRNPNE